MGKLCIPALCLGLLLAPHGLRAQQAATVAGRVVGESGAPLASVSIYLPALSLGTLSRADGTYTLTVPAARLGSGQSVQISAQILGHRAQTRTVQLAPGQAVMVDFQLQTDVLQLEGIVAIGIGQTTTRERLGVSISSVQGQDLVRVATPNVVSAIAGKAAGVEITSSSGEPGASASIRIRGVNTISGSGQPLFVVDGIPIDNSENVLPNSVQYGEASDLANTVVPNRASDINPNDIASLEILKGAAASAIYGARAANGVVLITTKRGQPGQTRVSLVTSIADDRVNKAIPLQRSFGQGSAGVNNTTGLRSWGGSISEAYDHWGELFEAGQMIDSNLTISGGSERTDYFLSVGRVTHDGVIVGGNDHYDKTTARLKAVHEVVEGLRVTGNFAFTETDGGFIQKGSNLSGLLLGGLRTPPNFNNHPYRTPEGFHRSYTIQEPTSLMDWGFFDNPFWTINENRTTSELARMFGNISVDWKPVEPLSFNYTIGNDFSNDNRVDLLPPGNYTWVTGYIGKAQFRTRQLTNNLTGSYTHRLNEEVGGTLTLGFSRESRTFDRYFVEGQDFIAPAIHQLDNTVTRTPNEYRSRIHSESFFGQLQTDLYDQLFLTAAVRNDGYSTFGESQKRHWFPKASAAWEFTKTLGLDGNGFVEFGKLRAAWGQAGNEPPVYGTIFGFSAAEVGDGWNPILRSTLGGQGGVYSDLFKAQPDLKPERTTEIEAGLDLSLLRSRLGLGVTFYNARTEDAIFQTPLSPSTGFFAQLQNAGVIRNRGWEVTLDAQPYQSPQISWNVGVSWATNNNRVLSLGDTTRQFVTVPDPNGGGFVGISAVVGERIGVMRGNDFYRCGIGDLPANVQQACSGAPKGALYVGEGGFPVLDPETRVIGDPHPDWTAGIRNSVTLLNNLQISALLDIKQGGDVWNGTRGALYSYGTHKDTEQRATCTAPRGNQAAGCTGNEKVFGTDLLRGPVVGPGAGKAVPIGQNWYQLGLGSGFSAATAQFIEDGSYVKLREVAVNYTLPASLAQRVGMSQVDLRLAGRNLHTWTDYTGIDPETNLTGTSALRGQDYFNNPQTRSLIVTVGLTR